MLLVKLRAFHIMYTKVYLLMSNVIQPRTWNVLLGDVRVNKPQASIAVYLKIAQTTINYF